MAQADLIEAGPDLVRTPFVILCDLQEKAPWTFTGLRARSFCDKDMREYLPRVERRFLGVGMGDYSLADYQGRVAIERKSMADWQGTLLGWRHESEDEDGGEWHVDNDRRGRFKRELGQLTMMEAKAVVVEANLNECLEKAPSWGKRSAEENMKYLLATFLAWSQEFPGVPWHFCSDRRMAEVVCFRLLEKFWASKAGERRQAARKSVRSTLKNKQTQQIQPLFQQ